MCSGRDFERQRGDDGGLADAGEAAEDDEHETPRERKDPHPALRLKVGSLDQLLYCLSPEGESFRPFSEIPCAAPGP